MALRRFGNNPSDSWKTQTQRQEWKSVLTLEKGLLSLDSSAYYAVSMFYREYLKSSFNQVQLRSHYCRWFVSFQAPRAFSFGSPLQHPSNGACGTKEFYLFSLCYYHIKPHKWTGLTTDH